MAVARTDNLHVLWGLLVLAGLGIGGIVVPASIITTIICPDVSCPSALRATALVGQHVVPLAGFFQSSVVVEKCMILLFRPNLLS